MSAHFPGASEPRFLSQPSKRTVYRAGNDRVHVCHAAPFRHQEKFRARSSRGITPASVPSDGDAVRNRDPDAFFIAVAAATAFWHANLLARHSLPPVQPLRRPSGSAPKVPRSFIMRAAFIHERTVFDRGNPARTASLILQCRRTRPLAIELIRLFALFFKTVGVAPTASPSDTPPPVAHLDDVSPVFDLIAHGGANPFGPSATPSSGPSCKRPGLYPF
jgi:hypothetical protein